MIEPSSFPADPLGWLGNQAGHLALCLVASYWLAVGYWKAAGEYPYRWQIAAVVCVAYLAIELPQDGGFWDTAEDIMVVVCYGSMVFIFPFRERAPGDRVLSFDPFSMMPAALIVSLHMAIGASIRAWQLYQGGQQ